MNLIQCKNGHYYNADKLEECPHCMNEKIKIPIDDLTGKKQDTIETYVPQKQILEKYEKASQRFITGWLVCIHGNMKGDCFMLFSGDNHIGRDTSMDVILFQEPTVSRCNHAIITYYADTAQFILSTELDTVTNVFCNNQPVTKEHPVALSYHDRILLGECTLAFIPFCGDLFQWEEKTV